MLLVLLLSDLLLHFWFIYHSRNTHPHHSITIMKIFYDLSCSLTDKALLNTFSIIKAVFTTVWSVFSAAMGGVAALSDCWASEWTGCRDLCIFYGRMLKSAYDCSKFPQIVFPAGAVQCLVYSEGKLENCNHFREPCVMRTRENFV